MKKVFLFDVGGVIKYPFIRENFYKSLNIKDDYNKFNDYFAKTCALAESSSITEEDFFNGIAREFDLDLTYEEIIDIYNKCQSKYNLEVFNLLKTLREHGNKVYILSNLKKIDYDNFINDMPFECFDKFYKSYEIGFNKPDKEIFEYVIKDIGVKPSNILFFDDKEDNVNSAISLGIDARKVDVYNIVKYFEDNNFFDII